MEEDKNLSTEPVEPQQSEAPLQPQPVMIEEPAQASVEPSNEPTNLTAPVAETLSELTPQAAEMPQEQTGPILVNEAAGFEVSKHKKLGTFIILGMTLGGMALLALASSDPGFVNMIGGFMQLVAIIFTFMAGFSAARTAQQRIDLRNAGKPYSRSNTLTTLGIVLCVLGAFTGGILLIPGIVMLVIGSKKPQITVNPKKPLPKFAKFLLVGLSFLAGFIPAAIFSLFLLLIVSMHYCELTSPKCL